MTGLTWCRHSSSSGPRYKVNVTHVVSVHCGLVGVHMHTVVRADVVCHGRSMGNMVTNVCAKSNYDQLQIDKALGLRESDNGKKHKNKKSKNNVRSDWVSLLGQKIENWLALDKIIAITERV